MAAEFAYDYSYNSAAPAMPERAPQRRPQKEKTPGLHALERPETRTNAQENPSAVVVVAKFMSLVVFSVICFSIICSSFAAVRSEKLNYSKMTSELEIYKSQQVEVDAQLGTLVTADKIAKIAVEKLGMVKLSNENKTYALPSEDNRILISAGR